MQRRRIHNLRQKDRRVTNDKIVILNPLRDWYYPISFFIVHFVVGLKTTALKPMGKASWTKKLRPSLQDHAGKLIHYQDYKKTGA
ncbi:hypothetical protein BN1180_00852 [Peribacillus simplex]|uniref:Uncharacterized protein n=1 Tax=Peribacillus simplex TaxID=1478 RepID=A0AAN2PDR8_9BACI|nr:hypothetical protein BN1180_00852 [Peribacillus simplex]